MKMNLYKSFYTILAVVLFSVGCTKEYESIEELDAVQVQEYLKKNNLTGQFEEYNDTGIYYKIIEPGTGEEVDYTDKVFSTFTAKSLDGAFSLQNDSLNRFTSYLGYFSNAYGYPAAFSSTIKDILKKKGGTLRLIIPSHLAYGRGGNSSLKIPGNASLDCTIKLYDVNNQTEFEDIFVKKYFQSSKINIEDFERTSSGLYYQVIKEGTNDTLVTVNSNVTVAYTGKLTNGTVFDESTSYTSILGYLVPGWQQGLPFIRKGGKIRLIIPPALGYGSAATGKIPPYSTLDFVIELLDVD